VVSTKLTASGHAKGNVVSDTDRALIV
jgi:hypothetical protein